MVVMHGCRIIHQMRVCALRSGAINNVTRVSDQRSVPQHQRLRCALSLHEGS
jgi:hypothetical protein